jgi:hypothetical protein
MDKSKLEADSFVDQSKLEVPGDSGVCVTVLDVGKLGEATRRIAESQASSGPRGWRFIAVLALVTWACAASVICVMQARTIDQLQVIRNESAERVIGKVHVLKEAAADGKEARE